MADRPRWRMPFDRVEREVGSRLESFVQTEQFADLVALATRVQVGLQHWARQRSRDAWHLINLPAHTDVGRLSEHVVALDRSVRRLTDQVQKLHEEEPHATGHARPRGNPLQGAGGVTRAGLRARNGLKYVAGVDRPRVGVTPKDVVWRRDRCELWHYRNDDVRYSPPVFIVMSLISRSYVLDLTPGNSFIEKLLDAGLDVFLLDWGVTDERDAGNTLEDYVDGYLSTAVVEALDFSGAAEVNVFGYCFGGVLALLLAAAHPELPIRSLTTMATPVDMTEMGLFAGLFRDGRLDADSVLDDTGNAPPEVVRRAFRVLRPTAEIAQYATLWERLWDEGYLVGYQAMRQWTRDHIPFPGATLRQVVEMMVRDNGLVEDRIRLAGKPVHLSSIRCPFLNVIADKDHIVPAAAAAPLLDLVGSPDRDELRLQAGHVGLVAGRTAAKVTIPTIVEFLRRRSDRVDTEPAR